MRKYHGWGRLIEVPMTDELESWILTENGGHIKDLVSLHHLLRVLLVDILLFLELLQVVELLTGSPYWPGGLASGLLK